MIQLRRRTVTLAAVVIAASFAIAVASFVRTADAGSGFTDTPPWIAAHAEWLQDNGIADGYPTNPPTFKPDESISRGQNAYWLGNYNDAIELVERGPVGSSGNQFTHYAACPAGKRAVAGGGTPTPPDIDLFMTASQPVLTTGGESRWVTIWTTRDRGTASANFTLWALCAPDTIPE